MSDNSHDIMQLRLAMTRMGGMVENQTAMALRAVLHHDDDAAERAMRDDMEVDEAERAVESQAMAMLAKRAAATPDLQELVSALKISSALERIGDYAANIGKRSRRLGPVDAEISLGGLRAMGRLVQESLRLAVDAVGERDPAKAIDVWRSDQAVDELYTAFFRELITHMMEDPRRIGPCTHLLFIAKNLERIGDHATNIAEQVHYAATGEKLPAERPKGAGPD